MNSNSKIVRFVSDQVKPHNVNILGLLEFLFILTYFMTDICFHATQSKRTKSDNVFFGMDEFERLLQIFILMTALKMFYVGYNNEKDILLLEKRIRRSEDGIYINRSLEGPINRIAKMENTCGMLSKKVDRLDKINIIRKVHKKRSIEIDQKKKELTQKKINDIHESIKIFDELELERTQNEKEKEEFDVLEERFRMLSESDGSLADESDDYETS